MAENYTCQSMNEKRSRRSDPNQKHLPSMQETKSQTAQSIRIYLRSIFVQQLLICIALLVFGVRVKTLLYYRRSASSCYVPFPYRFPGAVSALVIETVEVSSVFVAYKWILSQLVTIRTPTRFTRW